MNFDTSKVTVRFKEYESSYLRKDPSLKQYLAIATLVAISIGAILYACGPIAQAVLATPTPIR